MILDVRLVRYNERGGEADPGTDESSIEWILPSVRGISGERISGAS
jgi:hypothetical protein